MASRSHPARHSRDYVASIVQGKQTGSVDQSSHPPDAYILCDREGHQDSRTSVVIDAWFRFRFNEPFAITRDNG